MSEAKAGQKFGATEVEFDAETIEFGLGGIIIRPKDEQKLWEAARTIGPRRQVHVVMSLKE